MEVDVRQVEDVIIVDLKGRLVAGVGDEIVREVINRLLADDWKKILLNLSEVAMIDSSGVGELVAGRNIAERFGAGLKLLRPVERVRKSLDLSKVLLVLEVFDDEALAVESFATPAG